MKKLIILITVSLLGVNLLTGCGKDNKIKVEDKKENIVLTFFGFKVGETQYEMLEKLINGFESENPGIKINYEGIANADGYLDLLYKRIDGEEADDLFMLNPFAFTVAKKRGYIGTYIYDLKNEDFLNQYNDTIRALMNIDGHVLAIPMESSAIGLLVNIDLLDKYGLDIPENYGSFLNCCEVLGKNRITPIAVCFVDGGISSGPNFAIGRSLCDIDLNSLDFEALKSGRKSIGEIFRPGFELVKEFTQKKYWKVIEPEANRDWAEDGEMFIKGEVAFIIVGSWRLPKFKLKNISFAYKFIALPFSDSGNIAIIRASTPICVNSKGKHLDLSLKFLEYISQVKHVEAFTISQNALSPLKNGVKPVAILEDINKTIQTGRITTDSDPRFPFAVLTQSANMCKAIASGKMTVDEAVVYFDTIVNKQIETPK